MRSAAVDWLALLGRVFMSAIFLLGGFRKAFAPAATMAMFAKQGLPMLGAAYALALFVEIGGGLLVLFGWRTRLAGLVLAAWCVATGLIAHYRPDNAEQMINFMKNICMAGGFLQLAAFGAGRLSVDRS